VHPKQSRPARRLPPLATTALATLLLVVLGCAFFSGCALPGQTVNVLVNLPDTPELWVAAWGPSGYRIHWQAYPTVSGAVDVDPGVGAVVLKLPMATVVPLLAWPVWETGGPAFEPTEMLRPAGGVWVGDTVSADSASPAVAGLSLTFENGPAGFVLNRAAGYGADIQAFNHERLIAEIPVRLSGDPWLLDTDRIVRALCEQAMRVSYIREASLMEVSLEVPDGRWYGASPFGEPMNGGTLDHRARVGLTAYYDDRGRRLVVVVDEEARAWCAISPPD